VSLLVLFDVDGTLLLSHDEIYVEANRAALAEVYGLPVEVSDVPGETALSQTRRALRQAGRADEEIDAHLAHWCSVFSVRYVELLQRTDTSHWRVAPHARETVSVIDRRAVVTGNPETVARARLERIGLSDLFAQRTGAYGCESEDRVTLLELARSRAGNWPADQTVAIGDTPLDISSAHTAGCRCVAVTTGRYSAGELDLADAVIGALADLPAALAEL
jgi:phosphoglycolate phosphatase